MKPHFKSSLLPWPCLWQAWWTVQCWTKEVWRTNVASTGKPPEPMPGAPRGGFLFIRVTYLKMVFCILWSARLLCKADLVLDPTEYSACVLWGKGGASISFTLFRSRGFLILLASYFRFSVTVLGFWGLLRRVRQLSPCVRQLLPQEAGHVTWPHIPLPGSPYFLIFPFDV